MNDVLCRRSMESCMVPTFLTAEVAQAAQCGQLARICKWLNEGGPINARDVFQCSLLHLAAGAGQVIVVQELVKRGADLDERMPDVQYAQGKTALHRACEEVTLPALYRADNCSRSIGITDYTCRQNLGAGQENLYPRDILQTQSPPLQSSDLPANYVGAGKTYMVPTNSCVLASKIQGGGATAVIPSHESQAQQ